MTPAVLPIFWIVFWVTHHSALPFYLDYNFFLVARHCVWSLEIAEKAEKKFGIREKTEKKWGIRGMRETCHTPPTLEEAPL